MPKRTLYQNTFYHVYNRGWEKKIIFRTRYDYDRFLEKMDLLLERFSSVKIISMALLPNHFHLLVKDTGEEENTTPGSLPGVSLNISLFLGHLQNSYAQYFNKRNDSRGQLFEGRFCSKEVSDEAYFYQLKAYIEWNPVKHGIVQFPEEWPYSTYDSKTSQLPENILEDEFEAEF